MLLQAGPPGLSSLLECGQLCLLPPDRSCAATWKTAMAPATSDMLGYQVHLSNMITGHLSTQILKMEAVES